MHNLTASRISSICFFALAFSCLSTLNGEVWVYARILRYKTEFFAETNAPF
ncbi:MAG: hypothetical protein ACYCWE_05620 [Eubacteriales bacterium]